MLVNNDEYKIDRLSDKDPFLLATIRIPHGFYDDKEGIAFHEFLTSDCTGSQVVRNANTEEVDSVVISHVSLNQKIVDILIKWLELCNDKNLNAQVNDPFPERNLLLSFFIVMTDARGYEVKHTEAFNWCYPEEVYIKNSGYEIDGKTMYDIKIILKQFKPKCRRR